LKSLAIVQENQVCNKAPKGCGQITPAGVLNDNDFYIRVDPKLRVPEPELEEGEFNGAKKTPTNFCEFSVFSSVQNPMLFQSKRSRSTGGTQNVETASTTKCSEWCASLFQPGNTMREYLERNTPLLQTDLTDNESSHDELIDIQIELPVSYIASDPPLPGNRSTVGLVPAPDLPTIVGDYSQLSYLNESGKKLSRLSKRRRNEQNEPEVMKKTEMSLPSTNGLHLQSISSIASPFRVKEGIFLPHVRKSNLQPILVVQNNNQISLVTTCSGEDFYSSKRYASRPSFRTKRHPNVDIDPSENLDQNDWMRNVKESRTALPSFFLSELNSSNEILYDTTEEFFDSFEEHDTVLSTSIAIRGEFLHLSKKSKDISTVVAPACSLDLISMDLRKNDACSEPLMNTCSPKEQEQPVKMPSSSNGEVADVTSTVDKQKDEKQSRKRRERSEAKKLKKEHKRLKKEKKRERKADRKSRKRKTDHIAANGDDRRVDAPATFSSATDIPCIAVPSLHVGMTPMVMTRKIQTITEEVAVGVGPIISRQQNTSRYESIMQRKTSSQQHVVGPYSSTGIASKKVSDVQEKNHLMKTRQLVERRNDDKPDFENHFHSERTRNTIGMENPMIDYIPGSTLEEEDHNQDIHEAAIEYTSERVPQERQGRKDLLMNGCRNGDISTPEMESPESELGNINNTTPINKHRQRRILQRIIKTPATETALKPHPEQQYSDIDNSHEEFINNQDTLYKFDHEGPFDQDLQAANNIAAHNQNILNVSSSLKTALPLLCSERFLEQSSQASSELSSGRWVTALSPEPGPQPRLTENDFQTKFDLRDCSLVDDCGVDIELPDRIAIKVLWITSLMQKGSFDCKGFTKEVVQLTSSGRYETIHLMITLDSLDSLDPTYYLDTFTLLQNALVKQQGCPCQQISFHYLVPSILSSTIAQLALSHQKPSKISDISFESAMVEKSAFLLGISPSMTVYECISFLSGQQTFPFGKILLDVSRNSLATQRPDGNVLETTSLLQMNACLSSAVQSFGLH
jgi:hypothetical protein